MGSARTFDLPPAAEAGRKRPGVLCPAAAGLPLHHRRPAGGHLSKDATRRIARVELFAQNADGATLRTCHARQSPHICASAHLPAGAGRPSDYSDALAREICDRVEEGEVLEQITLDAHMPHLRTVRRWLEQHTDFATDYARARRYQPEAIAGRGFTRSLAWQRRRKPPTPRGSYWDVCKWMAARLDPPRWSERSELALVVTDPDAARESARQRAELVAQLPGARQASAAHARRTRPRHPRQHPAHPHAKAPSTIRPPPPGSLPRPACLWWPSGGPPRPMCDKRQHPRRSATGMVARQPCLSAALVALPWCAPSLTSRAMRQTHDQ